MANIYVEGKQISAPRMKESLLPADIAANGYGRGRCVNYGVDALHCALVTAAAVATLGILEEDSVSVEDAVAVIEFGPAVAQIGANIAAQQTLATDANGRLVPAQPGQPVVAIALETQVYVAPNAEGYTSMAAVLFLGSAGFTMPGDAVTHFVAAGAIPVVKGTYGIGSAAALAMTLAAPTLAQDGTVVFVTAETAHAHTVKTPANTINGSKDTVTFAAQGDGVELEAVGGFWNVRSLIGGAALSEV